MKATLPSVRTFPRKPVLRCPRCETRNADEASRCRKCDGALDLALLQVVGGDVPPTACALKPRPYTVGRSADNDVPLPEPSISRLHARILFERGRFFIEDNASRNGVRLGAEKVRRAELKSGCLLRLGRVTLKFTLLDQEASTTEGLEMAPSRLADTPGAGEREAAAEALDRLRLGVVLVAADGAVVLVNRSARAILDEGDGLSVGPGGLRTGDAATTRELRRLLVGEAEGGGARGGALPVPRASRRSLALLVTPLRREGGRLEAPRAVKAVFISDPERGVETGEEHLRRLYGLTPAEARLVEEILQGKTLDEAAGELAISVHTARDHLKRVFSKTGTRRQSQLVRLLLTGPALLRGD